MTPSFNYVGSGTQTQALGPALTDQAHLSGNISFAQDDVLQWLQLILAERDRFRVSLNRHVSLAVPLTTVGK